MVQVNFYPHPFEFALTVVPSPYFFTTTFWFGNVATYCHPSRIGRSVSFKQTPSALIIGLIVVAKPC